MYIYIFLENFNLCNNVEKIIKVKINDNFDIVVD